MNKAQIRKNMMAKRWALTSAYVSDQSDRVYERLVSLKEVCRAEKVMTYSHFSNEIKTGKLAGWLLFNKKHVFLPVVDGDILLVADMSSTCFEMNDFGIAQPEKATACMIEPEELDLVIVPGLAFDKKGNRIGFGKGFYDELLLKTPNAIKIALAYDFQIVDEIPCEEHDIKMDLVVTPKKVFGGKDH